MSYPDILPQEIEGYIEKTDWTQKDFSTEKAYVCAHFARLAYDHVGRYEIYSSRQIKKVPCSGYQTIAKSQSGFSTLDLNDESEPAGFVIERPNCVIVGVKAHKVIFVAVRGTANSHDWGINLKYRLKRVRIAPYDIYLHRGFLATVIDCLSLLQERIARLVNGDNSIPVYITGHSQGGAMATLIHSIVGSPYFAWPCLFHDGRAYSQTHSCYTFGMPRYGDGMAVSILRNPYHILRVWDIVPYLPAKWMSYADSIEEYLIGDAGINRLASRRPLSLARLFWSGAFVSVLKNHKMEKYIEGVRWSCPKPGNTS